jgi:hypothetical protein
MSRLMSLFQTLLSRLTRRHRRVPQHGASFLSSRGSRRRDGVGCLLDGWVGGDGVDRLGGGVDGLVGEGFGLVEEGCRDRVKSAKNAFIVASFERGELTHDGNSLTGLIYEVMCVCL